MTRGRRLPLLVTGLVVALIAACAANDTPAPSRLRIAAFDLTEHQLDGLSIELQTESELTAIAGESCWSMP